MTKKTSILKAVLYPYIMVGLVFAGTTFVSQNETQALGIVTSQDPAIALGAYGGFQIYLATTKITAQTTEMNAEINRIKAEAEHLGDSAAKLLGEADLTEKGKPVSVAETIYSQGRYGTAEGYKNNGGSSPALKDSKFRIQSNDAKKIVDSLLERQDLAKGKDFQMSLTIADGTLDGRIQTVSKTLSGSLKDVTGQLLQMVSSQAGDTPRGSIVEVRFNWSEIAMPNPSEARALRAKSAGVLAEQEKLKTAESARIAEVEGRYAKALQGLKRIRIRGGGMIVGAILLGTLSDGISAEMTTLAQACESADVMKTQIVSKAIKSGASEDEVAFELQSLCVE